MKKILIHALAIVLFTDAYTEDNTKSSCNPILNPQDAPIFYENNPLTELRSFTVITSFILKDREKCRKIINSIEKTLETIGKVVHLKDNDMRGFGTGNILLIQIGNVVGWDGEEAPLSRLSLSVETSVTLDKTDIKTFPMVWSINTFVQGHPDSSSEATLTKAMEKLVSDFAHNYRYANQGQSEIKNPVFYTYD